MQIILAQCYISFNPKKDPENEYNEMSHFLNTFFIRGLSEVVGHSLETYEHIAKTTFVTPEVLAFKETVSNLSNKIMDNIHYEKIATENGIEKYKVNFQFEFNQIMTDSIDIQNPQDFIYLAITESIQSNNDTLEMFDNQEKRKGASEPIARARNIISYVNTILNEMKETIETSIIKSDVKLKSKNKF